MTRQVWVSGEVVGGLEEVAGATGCSVEEAAQVALWAFAQQSLFVRRHFVLLWWGDHAGDPPRAGPGVWRRLLAAPAKVVAWLLGR